MARGLARDMLLNCEQAEQSTIEDSVSSATACNEIYSIKTPNNRILLKDVINGPGLI